MYYPYGTVLKVFRKEKQLTISENREVNHTILSAIGLYRFKIIDKMEKFTPEAKVEILPDYNIQDFDLIESPTVKEIKKKAISLINSQSMETLD